MHKGLEGSIKSYILGIYVSVSVVTAAFEWAVNSQIAYEVIGDVWVSRGWKGSLQGGVICLRPLTGQVGMIIAARLPDPYESGDCHAERSLGRIHTRTQYMYPIT